MVKAIVHSDDYVFEVEFDATPYLEQADDEDLEGLVEYGYGGDYASDDVAIFFKDTNPEIEKLFDYLDLIKGTSASQGFECNLDSKAAAEWLHANRYELMRKIFPL